MNFVTRVAVGAGVGLAAIAIVFSQSPTPASPTAAVAVFDETAPKGSTAAELSAKQQADPDRPDPRRAHSDKVGTRQSRADDVYRLLGVLLLLQTR